MRRNCGRGICPSRRGLPQSAAVKRATIDPMPTRHRTRPRQQIRLHSSLHRIDLANDLRNHLNGSTGDIMKISCFTLGQALLALAAIFFLTGCGSYNRLVTLEQNANKKWADVQSVYQRRADLIPNLVNTVAGSANFEKSTLTEVTNARASVGRVSLPTAPTDPARLAA